MIPFDQYWRLSYIGAREKVLGVSPVPGDTRSDRPFTPEEAKAQQAGTGRDSRRAGTGFDPFRGGAEQKARAKRGNRC